jgi:hypothetical protein
VSCNRPGRLAHRHGGVVPEFTPDCRPVRSYGHALRH